jgi:hypothetical protein
MPSGNKLGRKHVLVLIAFAALLALVLPLLGNTLGFGLSLVAVLGYVLVVLAAYAIFLVGMPFFFWIIGEAGYRTFFEPYVRLWHIRRIRNRRLWDEVASREHSDST